MLTNYIERLQFGVVLTLLSMYGIPFVPFVPVVVLFGGFKLNGSMGDGLGSIASTIMIGIASYAVLIAVLIHNI